MFRIWRGSKKFIPSFPWQCVACTSVLTMFNANQSFCINKKCTSNSASEYWSQLVVSSLQLPRGTSRRALLDQTFGVSSLVLYNPQLQTRYFQEATNPSPAAIPFSWYFGSEHGVFIYSSILTTSVWKVSPTTFVSLVWNICWRTVGCVTI